jgi:hypothetical protein
LIFLFGVDCVQKKHSQALIEMQRTLLYLERDFSQVFNQEITLSEQNVQLNSVQNDTNASSELICNDVE